MSPAPAKFTFDLDLGRRAEPAPAVSEATSLALQQQARAEGYAEGFKAGETSTASATAQGLAMAANALADLGAEMLRGLDEARHAARREGVELAGAIGRKLAAALLAEQPAAELEALLVDCLASLDGVPHLVIRCNPELADSLRDIAAARIATSGFTGRLIVMGDPEIKLGDGRIEWVDGGLVRDLDAISAQIDDRIAAYLAARGTRAIEEHP